MIHCDLCRTSFSTHYSWQIHLELQQHKALAAERDKRQESADRSIYITGFARGTPGMMIAQYFLQFGTLFNNPIIERQKGVYAILEFEDKISVDRVLHYQNHYLGGRRLNVRPRHIKWRESQIKRENRKINKTGCETSYSDIVDLLLNQRDVALQMVLLADALRLTDADVKERENICNFFRSVFADFFVYSEVDVFGSSANGLGKRGCDLDLLLSLKKELDDTEVKSFADTSDVDALSVARDVVQRNYRKLTIEELVKLSPVDIINLVKKIVKKRGVMCSEIFSIPSKRCPIVRFFIKRDTKISVDLSVKNRLSLYNSKLVHLFMKSDERVLPLTYTIKYWIFRRELSLTQTNKLSSYSATLLVIFYLQNTNPPILPPVEKLRQSLTESRIQGGWECNFSDDLSKFPLTENEESLSGLLKGFFDYYNMFDFDGNAVCPCTGTTISKEKLKDEIPNFNDKFISVQDPFDLSHNTTGNIDDFLTAKIIQAFSDASNILENRNVYKQKISGKPWGLISLFDNIHEANEGLFPFEEKPDVKELETIVAVENPKPPDEDAHLANNVKIKMIIFNACDVEYFKSKIPIGNGETGADEPEWFRRVCKAVHSVFSVALQFSCTSEDHKPEGIGNKRRLEDQNERNNKRMRRADGMWSGQPSQSVSNDSWDDLLHQKSAEKSLSRFDRFVCHVYHRTWVGRKKAGNIVKQTVMSVLQCEETISKQIIGDSTRNKPLYSFLCKVGLKPLPEVDLTIIALSESPELKSNTLSFLQSYVPKVLKQLQSAKEIL
uniref:Speckle targeted PIP5K1A-regulated poly(A) polymerase n=1 Tax=Strigamia maritima TaxID=126957 RepID=T1J892_STRMM